MDLLARYGPFAFVIAVIAALVPPNGNDFPYFWFAGRIVAAGGSVYDDAQWLAAGAYGPSAGVVLATCSSPDASAQCHWLYPPWTAWVYAPFAALDMDVALAAIAMLTVATLVIGILAAARVFGLPAGRRGALALAALAASAPVEHAAVGGHFIGLVLIGVVAVDVGLRDRHLVSFLAGAVLLSLKPHVVLVLGLVIAVELMRRRMWTHVVGALALVFLIGLGVAADRHAIDALMRGGAEKMTADNSSLLVQSGEASAVTAALVALVGVAASAAAVRAASSQRRLATLVAAGAALSLVIAPYVHSYDQVLLLPAILVTYHAAGQRAGPIILLGLIALGWAGYALELAHAPAATSAALPTVTLVSLALVQRRAASGRPSVRLIAGAPVA